MSRFTKNEVMYYLEWGKAKEEGTVITLEEVKYFMKKQPNKQIEGVQTDIMDIPTLTKYNSTKHSSTRAKLVDAHKDENRVEVNFTLKQTHFRKHPELNVRTRYNIYIYERSWELHFKKRDSQFVQPKR